VQTSYDISGHLFADKKNLVYVDFVLSNVQCTPSVYNALKNQKC